MDPYPEEPEEKRACNDETTTSIYNENTYYENFYRWGIRNHEESYIDHDGWLYTAVARAVEILVFCLIMVRRTGRCSGFFC